MLTRERCKAWPTHHLVDDAADRPHVDCARVARLAEQDLGRAVPEGHHLVRIRAARVCADSPRELELPQLELASSRIDKHGLWLQVAVEDAVGVAPRHPVEHLVGERLDVVRRQLVLLRPHVPFQIELAELEDRHDEARHDEDSLHLKDVCMRSQLLHQ